MGQKDSRFKEDMYTKRMKLHARQMDMLSDLELSQLHRIDLLNQSYKANYEQ